MTGVQARIERVEPGTKDFVVDGPYDQVIARVRPFATRPDALAILRPETDPARPGWAKVRVRLRDTQQPAARAPMRVTVQNVWPARRPPATPVRDRAAVVGEVALYFAGLVVTGGIVWMAVAAARGAMAWAASHVVPIVLIVVAATAIGLLVVSNRRGKPGGVGGCPGITHHCRGCGDHR